MAQPNHPEDITFTFDDRTSGDSKVSILERSKPSEEDLAKIEVLFKKHIKTSKKATKSMSKSAKSLEDMVISSAIGTAPKKPGQFVAVAGLAFGILALLSLSMLWALDSRLTSYEDTLKRQLITYEGVMGAVASNLEGLRQDSLEQISIFSNVINTMNGRINDVHDTLLPNTSDKDGPLDAAAQSGE